MTERRRDPIIRRILVALDASPHSLAALETATRLAALFGAELLGVYVEDINLLRASQLPFTREIRLHSGARRRLGTEQIERELRAQAELARRALTVSADRARVRWSFRVCRGTVVSELFTAASEMDLVILGRSGWSPIERRRLGSTARALLSQGPRPALVLQRGTRLRPPVAVLYEGSALGQKAVRVAATLAQGEDSHLVVLLVGDEAEATRMLRKQVSGWLEDRRLLARYRHLPSWKPSQVANSLKSEGVGGLVLPATSEILEEGPLLALLEETEIPVLLVR